jgi:rhodanese-related sulfurtransferase
MIKELSPEEFLEARRRYRDDAAGCSRGLGDHPGAGPSEVVHIPMGQIADRLAELDPLKEWVVICRSGGRSLQVATFLAARGFGSVYNLAGGILAWSRDIDPRIPQY